MRSTSRLREIRTLTIRRLTFSIAISMVTPWADAGVLRAGAAKVDVTDTQARPAHDRLYVRALVLDDGTTRAAIVAVDAVAIGEIGPIGNDYLPKVRSRLEKELGIGPANLVVNASHCHGIVGSDVDQKTVQAVKEAVAKLVPVKVGAGAGHEARIMENRRIRLKDGAEADVRHAYSMPPDEDVAEVGPVDSEIGILRLDRHDGRTLAVVYNFACHPIQGVPGGGNTADISGFSSRVIEENLSEATVALFLQGCGGDINPVSYKDVDHPRDAEPLGDTLGLSTLRAVRKIAVREDPRLKVVHETLALPRADLAGRIKALEAEQARLVRSLKGTSLSLKTFLPLVVKYRVSGEFPSYYASGYLHERATGRDDLDKLDAENRNNLEEYVGNIHTMEALTRLGTNLELLRKHQARNVAAGMKAIDVELSALRVGDFVLATFPGELTVRIGLGLKQRSPHELTFISGYTNGYLYYSPTEEQLRNAGSAQEDCDCLLGPGWQRLFEDKMLEMLREL
jgi:hypothetical protein